MKFEISLKLAFVVLSSLLAGSQAIAQTPWLDYGVIRKDSSHQCITVKPNTPPGNPAPVILLPCSLDTVVGEQVWGWSKVEAKVRGGLDVYAFQNVTAKTCLGVVGDVGSEHARLLAVPCDFANPSQLWLASMQMRRTLSPPGATKWVNLKSRKCIDVGDEGELRQSKCQLSAPYWPQEFSAPRR